MFFVRQWSAPLAGALTLLYLTFVVFVIMSSSSSTVLALCARPGALALVMGTPILAPFGLAEWSWLGYMPTNAGFVVLVFVYTFVITTVVRIATSSRKR